MANRLAAMRAGLATFLAVSTFLMPAVNAKDFVSNQHGFRFKIPNGFRERPTDNVNGITSFVEADSIGGDDPIKIDIRRTSPGYSPAVDSFELAELPRKKGWTYSREPRTWKELELQVIRQEIAISSNQAFLAYIVVFPLLDQGIIISVQGPRQREREVVKAFDEAFGGFVNTKPAAVGALRRSGSGATAIIETLISILLPLAMGALIVFWVVRVRKSQVRSAKR